MLLKYLLKHLYEITEIRLPLLTQTQAVNVNGYYSVESACFLHALIRTFLDPVI